MMCRREFDSPQELKPSDFDARNGRAEEAAEKVGKTDSPWTRVRGEWQK
jgi:hypothetical protein